MTIRDRHKSVSRRDFVKTGAGLVAMAATGSLVEAAEKAAATASAPASRYAGLLPTRSLGRTGAKVTMLAMGGSTNLNARLLEHAWSQGVRYFDTAASYTNGKSEQAIGGWLQQTGRRKEVFLVTKNGTRKTKDLLSAVDKRLEALQTDFIDLYCLHGLGGPAGVEQAKSPETREVAEDLKKSGKIRFFGFSTHSANAPDCLLAAAEGGFVDAIMMAYNPVSGPGKDEAFDRALDACQKAGIGLIAMKTVRGMQKAIAAESQKGRSFPQAAIQAVLSDERIAAVCSEMSSFTHVDQNTQAVRDFRRPTAAAHLEPLREAALAGGMAFCAGCPACRKGILAGNSRVHDILRYLSYYEQDGKRALARAKYQALPAAVRHVANFDLAAARDACVLGIDYPALMARAQRAPGVTAGAGMCARPSRRATRASIAPTTPLVQVRRRGTDRFGWCCRGAARRRAGTGEGARWYGLSPA